MAIRRYGPGKYSTILDSYVHDLLMEGWGGETVGDVSEIGIAYDRFHLGDEGLKRIEELAKEQKDDPLTEEEGDLVSESFGVIVSENDQGFVYIDYYDKERDYDAAWKEVEESVEEGEEDEGEEGEEEEEEEEAEV